jgi:RND superfamily putative drug exporter
MVAVFASFILGDSRTIKEFGVGLASAIFVDVVFVRLIIVPAVITLIGNRSWWFPRGLDNALPRLDIEGADAHHKEPVMPVNAPSAG